MRRYGGLLVALAVVALFAYALYETQTWSATRSRTYAIGVVGLGLALALIQAAREALLLRAPATERAAPRGMDMPIGIRAVGWAAAFYALAWALGMVVTVPLYAVAYLRLGGKIGWPLAVGYAAAAAIFTYGVFVSLLHIPLPAGALVGGLGQ